MLQGKNAPGEFWCPTEEKREARKPGPTLEMTPADWAALSRFCSGEWVSDAQIERMQSLGLVERVFGQPLLTRLGRTTIGIEG
jgi:hypothetical protein